MRLPSLVPQWWWQHGVIYEIYVRSFMDSNGDGVGDLPGIIERIDYLNDGTQNSLGIDAIWLTPMYPSPLFDFGYDVSDYTNVDPVYGTLEDFDRLASEAAKRGINIILDLVLNHSSHLHPWFQDSRLSRQSAYRDWYVWKDPAHGGGPPNNWKSVFGGPAWTFDETTRQYYLHSFLPQQPDLNWRNPTVRQAMCDVVRFWVRRGVAGFRLDATSFIGKDILYRNNPTTTPSEDAAHAKDSTVVYSEGDPDMHLWLRELRHAADEDGIERFLVSEIYGPDAASIALLHGSEGPEMSMSFNFDLIGCEWSASAFRRAVESFIESLPVDTWPNTVFNNHDQPRFIERFDEDGHGHDRARLAAMLLFTLPGAAFVYYGEEIGMRNGHIPRERVQDPVGLRFIDQTPNPGRDPERTPMQWSGSDGAGFSSGEAWLPLGQDSDEINVGRESVDPGSMLSLYRSLIWLRRSNLALREGSYQSLDKVPVETYCFMRESLSSHVVVALNFGCAAETVYVAHAEDARLLVSTHQDRGKSGFSKSITLRPLEGLVLEMPPRHDPSSGQDSGQRGG